MEIIEIGAVRLDSDLEVVGDFDSFVRPATEPVLSPFCQQLTTISQADVDAADSFPAVFSRFLEWIGAADYRLCSWGAYDVTQFRRDCRRHGVVFPDRFEKQHVNLKELFAESQDVGRCELPAAFEHVGLSLVGTYHRGIDDARNIARIAQVVLPDLPVGDAG